jgi:1,4-dihydroxy-2-naphthoyl-CoA hydrolase
MTDSEQSAVASAALHRKMPFAGLLGIQLLEESPECVRARLEWREELRTVGELMHGGALMALADACGGVCASLNLPQGASGTATIESKTNFLRPLTSGAAIAVSRPLHVGRATIVIETEVRSAQDKLLAKTTQTQAVLKEQS